MKNFLTLNKCWHFAKIRTLVDIMNTNFLNIENMFDKMVLRAYKTKKFLCRCSEKEYPSVPHRPPQFNTKITPFQHPKSLSSTPKTPQFNTPLSSTSRSVQHNPQLNTKNDKKWLYVSKLYKIEGCVELRSVLN